MWKPLLAKTLPRSEQNTKQRQNRGFYGHFCKCGNLFSPNPPLEWTEKPNQAKIWGFMDISINVEIPLAKTLPSSEQNTKLSQNRSLQTFPNIPVGIEYPKQNIPNRISQMEYPSSAQTSLPQVSSSLIPNFAMWLRLHSHNSPWSAGISATCCTCKSAFQRFAFCFNHQH